MANDLRANDQTGSNKKSSATKLQQSDAMSMTPQQIISTTALEDGSIRSSMVEEKWNQSCRTINNLSSRRSYKSLLLIRANWLWSTIEGLEGLAKR
ncbi:MAG TPA: hypothetical protein QF700_02295 [Prochlorococcus sp.]|nr:hypothetical protein [Prochlorococcus sp.]